MFKWKYPFLTCSRKRTNRMQTASFQSNDGYDPVYRIFVDDCYWDATLFIRTLF